MKKKRTQPKILVCGEFWKASFELTWWTWLQDQGYPAARLDTATCVRSRLPRRFLRRWFRRFGRGFLAGVVGGALLESARVFRPDLVLVVSGRLVPGQALESIRAETGATLYHFYGEDFFNRLNTNGVLRQAAFSYDRCFTTKSFNVAEMAEIGITQVTYLPHGYRPNCHYPVRVSPGDRRVYGSDLTFVGTWESARARSLESLQGFDLRIWGNLWHRVLETSGIWGCVQNRAVYCEEMSRVFNASKICLAFMRRANRDLHTSRTFEIPACGGFQLSERTEEVLSFFEEGKEIECFSSVEELQDKATYYLTRESARQRIALAGLERVRRSRYSYNDRLQTVLDIYFNEYA